MQESSHAICCPLSCREKANLAVTLANETDNIVAQASFFDHPAACLVDQSQWEKFLKESFGVQQCTVHIIIIIKDKNGKNGKYM